MGRIGKLKRQLIEEANKRLLNEYPDPPEIKLYSDDEYNFNNSLYGYLDRDEFKLETEEEKKGFLYKLIHNEDIHIHPGINHWDIAFTHLGKHHNIEVDIEGHYPFTHSDDEYKKYSMTPDVNIGLGVKIPLSEIPLSFGGGKKIDYKL